MGFASNVPENVPDYLFHYKYKDSSTTTNKKNKNKLIQSKEP